MVDLDLGLWNRVAVESAPEIIGSIHDDYVAAGADIHLTHTFPLARHTLEVIGRCDDVPSLNRLAVDLCKQSIDRVREGRRRWGDWNNLALSAHRSWPEAPGDPSAVRSIRTTEVVFADRRAPTGGGGLACLMRARLNRRLSTGVADALRTHRVGRVSGRCLQVGSASCGFP